MLTFKHCYVYIILSCSNKFHARILTFVQFCFSVLCSFYSSLAFHATSQSKRRANEQALGTGWFSTPLQTLQRSDVRRRRMQSEVIRQNARAIFFVLPERFLHYRAEVAALKGSIFYGCLVLQFVIKCRVIVVASSVWDCASWENYCSEPCSSGGKLIGRRMKMEVMC